jgi:hypothetical protein
MNNNQLSTWLRIAEIKTAILSVAVWSNEDDMFTVEEAKKSLLDIADSVETLERVYLDDLNQLEIEASLKLETKAKEYVDLNGLAEVLKLQGFDTSELEILFTKVRNERLIEKRPSRCNGVSA